MCPHRSLTDRPTWDLKLNFWCEQLNGEVLRGYDSLVSNLLAV